MEACKETLLLFGDQRFDIGLLFPGLLSARDGNPMLRHFLERSWDALRTQIFELPRETGDVIPRYTSIEDLVLHRQLSTGPSRSVPLDMALTCMCQLACFLQL
jgi:hypothetical protein